MDTKSTAIDAVSLNSATAESMKGLKPALKRLVDRRRAVLGPSYKLHYQEPLHAVRAKGTRIWDADGNEYLDAYNSVASIGHAHPRVLEAVTRQMGLLNTHTRYLQDGIVDFAEDLLSTFDDHLDTVMITCTGSEANDLALRMARHVTGGTGVIVSEYAYHGSTHDVSSWSPSSGAGVPLGRDVRLVPPLDPARFSSKDPGKWFADRVNEQIEDLRRRGLRLAALVIDSLFSSDGIFPVPPGALTQAVEAVHRAGGLVVSDEVQAGHARTGDAMWGYQRGLFTPDLVTMGKPMGNGMPIAGVAARSSITSAFGKEVGYFNTFGGNTALVSAAQAVLDVIREEGLLANVAHKGCDLRAGLQQIVESQRPETIVRGAGLYVGVEFLKDGLPDPLSAIHVVNSMRRKGVLISAAGPFGNVLKIRPPLVFSGADVDLFLSVFEGVMEGARSNG